MDTGINTYAGVPNAQEYPRFAVALLRTDGQCNLAIFREAAGIIQQVDQHLADFLPITVHGSDVLIAAHVKGIPILVDSRLDALGYLPGFAADIEGLGLQLRGLTFQVSHIQNVVDDLQQLTPGFLHTLHILVDLPLGI